MLFLTSYFFFFFFLHFWSPNTTHIIKSSKWLQILTLIEHLTPKPLANLQFDFLHNEHCSLKELLACLQTLHGFMTMRHKDHRDSGKPLTLTAFKSHLKSYFFKVFHILNLNQWGMLTQNTPRHTVVWPWNRNVGKGIERGEADG